MQIPQLSGLHLEIPDISNELEKVSRPCSEGIASLVDVGTDQGCRQHWIARSTQMLKTILNQIREMSIQDF